MPLSSAMDHVIMDLTDSDDDLDIAKAVKKDLGHEDHVHSSFNTTQHLNTCNLHSPILQKSSTIMNLPATQIMDQPAMPMLSGTCMRSGPEVREWTGQIMTVGKHIKAL